MPKAPNPKKKNPKDPGVCAFPMGVCHPFRSLLLSEIKKNNKFPPSILAPTRPGQTPHTCSALATRHSSSPGRKALRGNRHRRVTAPWRAGQGLCWFRCLRAYSYQTGKSQNCRVNSLHASFPGSKDGKQVLWSVSFRHSWQNTKHMCMAPSSSWFICSICGEIHSLGRDDPDNFFYPERCVRCPYSSLHLLQKHMGEVELGSFSFAFPITVLTWLGLIYPKKSQYFDV